jgi:hypothetical protein
MKVTAPASVKPAHEKCNHCTSSGCSIYADRPEACATFECLWLASQKVPSLAFPAALRPDRCGVVIDLNAAGTVLAHCALPGSWKRGAIRSWLIGMAGRGHNVLLDTQGETALLKADGTTTRLRCIGVDPDTKNRLYVREVAA